MDRQTSKLLWLMALVGTLVFLAAPVVAQTQGSSSAGQTTSVGRYVESPKPVDHLLVTAVDLENGKVKLQHQRQGWEHWFQLSDDTVIRSAFDKKRILELSQVEAGQKASVFVSHKLFRGKTVYLNIEDAKDC